MAFGGDTSKWGNTFPENFVPDVLQLILDAWRQMKSVKCDAKENQITLQLCAVMRKLKFLRNSMFAIRPEMLVLDLESGKELGRIDLQFTHGDQEELYFAFECKRLYYQDSNKKVHANVSEYTGSAGIMCFVTEKYSRGLPHGGMIGYVLSGSLAKALTPLQKSMETNRTSLCLTSTPALLPCAHCPNQPGVLESSHNVNGRSMVLYHVLLPNQAPHSSNAAEGTS